MSTQSPATSEHDAIAGVLQHYIDGARSGRADDMRPAFHDEATVFGYIGEDLFAGPVQKLFDWHDENGPARELTARIVGIDLAETVASVRLELENWTDYRFTDLFTLLRQDGTWKIMNKVFHLHP
ncbi:MAG: nuclear transport factor 2 family protein [Geminicoccaceae bacterium]